MSKTPQQVYSYRQAQENIVLFKQDERLPAKLEIERLDDPISVGKHFFVAAPQEVLVKENRAVLFA